MKRLLIALACFLALTSCRTTKSDREISEIQKEYFISEQGKRHIDLSRVEQSQTDYTELKERIPEECYERFILHDLFSPNEIRFSIVKEKNSETFWIVEHSESPETSSVYQPRPNQSGDDNSE